MGECEARPMNESQYDQELMTESLDDIKKLFSNAYNKFKGLFHKNKKHSENGAEEKKGPKKKKSQGKPNGDADNKKKRKKNRKNLKYRKKSGGGRNVYDYDEYLAKNRKISKADTDSIIDRIDTDKTNIAAIAREVFPDHTDEGAQSHLLKILNRERPMTSRVASKLEELISTGSVAVKG